jgi:hypothetical protein
MKLVSKPNYKWDDKIQVEVSLGELASIYAVFVGMQSEELLKEIEDIFPNTNDLIGFVKENEMEYEIYKSVYEILKMKGVFGL